MSGRRVGAHRTVQGARIIRGWDAGMPEDPLHVALQPQRHVK